jgi:RNA 3'-terminal phosphate cyclase (ATP)
MLEIDGSIGEGGGQVLRTTLSMACVLGKKVRISNIRAGRSPPGLKAQHLAVCKLLAKICDAKVQGAEMGSTEIIFEPGWINGGEYSFDIGTAGSITLLFQAALPVLLHAAHPSVLRITGGTHVRSAPTFDYFSEVFLPCARRFGASASCNLVRAGFYPRGGGEALLSVQPSKLSGVKMGKEKHEVHCRIVSCSLPTHVEERERQEVERLLEDFSPKVEVVEPPYSSIGNAITIWSGTFGADTIGEKGVKAQDVAKKCCDGFLREIAGAGSVDAHLADQLLVLSCLAEGKSGYFVREVTGHLSTNAQVLRKMCARNISIGSDCVEVE